MRFAYLVILFFFALCSGCKKNSDLGTSSSHADVHRILQTIPEQDREALDSFFQLLLREYGFSYTLFGKKPMSMACYSFHLSSQSFYHPIDFFTFEKGWEQWQSYASLFPSHEFVLKRCKSDRGIWELFIISKKHALQAISDHLDTFQQILAKQIDPQQLLDQLCDSQQDVMKTLNDNSCLLGILLGYGEINAENFERKVCICCDLNAKMTPPFSAKEDMTSLLPLGRLFVSLYKDKSFSYPSQACFPLQGPSLAEELNDILSRQESFDVYGSSFFLDKMISPIFVAQKDDPETEKLHKDYLTTKQHLHQVYLQGSFLEITLNQWMYPQ